MNRSLLVFCLLATIFMINVHETEGCGSKQTREEQANRYFRSCRYDWTSPRPCCEHVKRRYGDANMIKECVDGGFAKKRKF